MKLDPEDAPEHWNGVGEYPPAGWGNCPVDERCHLSWCVGRIGKMVERIVVTLYGDSDDIENKPGLLIRVDRIFTAANTFKYAAWAIVGLLGILVSLCAWVFVDVKTTQQDNINGIRQDQQKMNKQIEDLRKELQKQGSISHEEPYSVTKKENPEVAAE
jgi:hypothetical protein